MTSAISPSLCPSLSAPLSFTWLHCSGLKSAFSCSLTLVPSHTFFLGLYLPLWISRFSIALLISLAFPCLLFSLHIFSTISGLIQTSISLPCSRTEQMPHNFVFCSACVFCVFTQKTTRCSESGCPLKSSVPSCFFFGWAERFQKLKTDLFQKSTYGINCCFYQLDNHDQKKEDGGRQLPITTTKTERNFTSACWNIVAMTYSDVFLKIRC